MDVVFQPGKSGKEFPIRTNTVVAARHVVGLGWTLQD